MSHLMEALRQVPNLHPIAVKFPIALLPVALILDLGGSIFRSRDLLVAGRWALFVGTLGAITAVMTGLGGADAVHPYVSSGAEELMTLHMNLQLATVAAAVFLSLWRLVARREPLPVRGRLLYLLLSAAMVVNLTVASDLGAQMVYLHGVAVSAEADSLQGGVVKEEDHHHHHLLGGGGERGEHRHGQHHEED